MSFAIIASDRFDRLIKRFQRKYRSMPSDFAKLLAELEIDPKAGEPLGRDCYSNNERDDLLRENGLL